MVVMQNQGRFYYTGIRSLIVHEDSPLMASLMHLEHSLKGAVSGTIKLVICHTLADSLTIKNLKPSPVHVLSVS